MFTLQKAGWVISLKLYGVKRDINTKYMQNFIP